MTEENVDAGIDLIELTKHIVHAYVSNNLVPAVELPHIIVDVHAAVRGLQSGSATSHPKKNSFPLFRSEKTVTPEFIICLEDGKQFKSLKGIGRRIRSDAGRISRQVGSVCDFSLESLKKAPCRMIYFAVRSQCDTSDFDLC